MPACALSVLSGVKFAGTRTLPRSTSCRTSCAPASRLPCWPQPSENAETRNFWPVSCPPVARRPVSSRGRRTQDHGPQPPRRRRITERAKATHSRTAVHNSHPYEPRTTHGTTHGTTHRPTATQPPYYVSAFPFPFPSSFPISQPCTCRLNMAHDAILGHFRNFTM